MTEDYLPGEIWLPVVDFYGLYEVSSKERVQSLDRIVVNGPASVRKVKGRVLQQFARRGGTTTWVCLARGGGKFPRRVEQLVREAFGEHPLTERNQSK